MRFLLHLAESAKYLKCDSKERRWASFPFPFLPSPPLPLPLLRLPRKLLTCCTAGSASFPVVLGDFGCDVTVKLVAFGSKPPLVTRIARTGLGTRLRYERWVSNSWVRSWKCRANRIFLIWILKGHYWHNPLVSHHSRWQDSHWPQPHNAVISATYLQTKDIWVDKNGSWPLTTVTNKRKIKELKTLLTKQNILEDVICYWAQKIMRDGNKLKLHLYFWGNCGFKLLLQWEHYYTK